jgi:photosystem II stability/assembly factor-like uncharacterized protein
VYALIEADEGGLFRSDDGGKKWTKINSDRRLRQRAWYYSHITVHPTRADEVWCAQVPMLRSIDGGTTFSFVEGIHHGDHHDVWFDPQNPNRIIAANDGGVDISHDGGETWYAPPLPISQFYHVSVDNRRPFHVAGTMQDIGTAQGPSNTLSSNGILNEDWYGVGGGEAGWVVSDPSDPNIVYAGEYMGYISRYDHRTRQAQNVSVYPENASGLGGESLTYRFQWTAPIVVSPHDSQVVYHAANVLFKTGDGGQSWQTIRPDLTLNLKSHQQSSGGVAIDNLMTYDGSLLFAIEESPTEPGLIWVGSNDGQVSLTMDYGKNWENVTKNISDLPEWGTVACIDPSPHKKGAAYIAVDMHQMGDFDPYIYYTEDYGKTWTKISDGIPKSVHSFVHVIKEDPKMPGLLFAGTDNSVYVSPDYGKTWEPLRNNMPPAPIYWLEIQEHFDDLVVATYGRGFYILDNLTPIREAAQMKAEAATHLFSLRPTYRFNNKEGIHTAGQDLAFGRNPDYGATIDYYLADSSDAAVEFTVTDLEGNVVRKLNGKTQSGLHRMN